jgi:hypothetical protein
MAERLLHCPPSGHRKRLKERDLTSLYYRGRDREDDWERNIPAALLNKADARFSMPFPARKEEKFSGVLLKNSQISGKRYCSSMTFHNWIYSTGSVPPLLKSSAKEVIFFVLPGTFTKNYNHRQYPLRHRSCHFLCQPQSPASAPM